MAGKSRFKVQNQSEELGLLLTGLRGYAMVKVSVFVFERVNVIDVYW